MPTHSQRARFGPFEIDLQCGEIRRAGILMRLPPQPFRILVLLLTHPGKLVTRQEICEHIWGSHTWVDFEHGLNFAIRRIRETLGDDSVSPRFIQTLPRRGYRFLGVVEWDQPAISEPNLHTAVTIPAAAPTAPSAVPCSVAGRSRAALRALVRSTQPLFSGTFLIPRRWILHAGWVGCLVTVIALLMWFSPPLRPAPQSWRTSMPPSHRFDSIAVLPLQDLSPDRDEKYLADSVTERLITNLGRIANLRVVSRTSVLQYQRGVPPMAQIARELNVDAVVEGTVQRFGNRISLTAQLLDARSDRHLWAATYDRDLGDVISVEEELALIIAHEISGRLEPYRAARLTGRHAIAPEAWDEYLQGRYLLSEHTPETASGAREYFEEALRRDSSFAQAWSGLADSYSAGWQPESDLLRAEQFARKAVSLEPNLPEGHASLGIIEIYRHNFSGGGAELRRAIALNPTYAPAHRGYALCELARGHPTEALAEIERARELDPFSFSVNSLRGSILLALREYDRAVRQFELAESINPSSPIPHQEIARIYWIQGLGDRVKSGHT